MKLTTLIIIMAFLQVSAASFGQRLTYARKSASIEQIIKEIRVQTGYNVIVSMDNVKNIQPIDVDFKNTSITDVLDQVLKDQPLTYEIKDKLIIIKKKEDSFLDKLKNQIKAELAQVTVTGKVTDELGNPMIAVTVKQKTNPNNGTVTDADGTYKLTVPDDNTIIVFSHIGYETQELKAKDIPPGSVIILTAAPQSLREVTINKGYYFEKSELTTGDVSTVNSKTLEEQPVFDPLQALEGQVAGLNIQQNSGVPGAYSVVRIRGVNSIANGTAPLYIIDGVPINNQSLSSNQFGNVLGFGTEGGINQTGAASSGSSIGGQSPLSALNMDDIESIEVLKDADATAIYGSRGANGVILITTKKGKPGATRVNLDLSEGIGQVGHFIDLMNTQQYLQMRRQAFTNDGLQIPSISVTPNDNNWDVNGVWDQNSYTNWQKVLIGNTAQYTNAQASVSGGNASTQFLVSSGYSRQSTVFPGDAEDRKGSMHFSLNHSSDDQKFHLQLGVNYIYDNNLLPLTDYTSNISIAPDAPFPYSPNGSINWGMYNGAATFSGNPLGATLQTSTAVTNNLISNMSLSYQLLPGLTLKSDLGFNHDEMNENSLTPGSSYAPPNNTNASLRHGYFSTTTMQTWTIEPQLSYQKKIGKGTLNALIGSTWQQNLQQNNSETTGNFTSDALIIDPAAASSTPTLYYTYSQSRFTSLYSRIAYDWDQKYLLNITGRRDGSSNFGPGKEFGNFGAIGAGWIFSKEKMVADAFPWLSFGKLRASYGTTGNDQLPPYQYLSSYNVNNSAYLGNTGLAPARLTNPYFAWEVINKLEGGLDLGFFKDRVDLSVNYYRDRTGNQLVGYPLSSVTGFTTIQYNLPAVVQNTGLEIQFATTNLNSKSFSWRTSVNFTLPNNKLVSYPNIAGSSYRTTYVVGQSLFIKEKYQYTGVNPQTGLYTVATANANGNPSSPQDLVTTAPITQKYYGGIQNSFTYKNLGFDIFFQFVKQIGNSYYPYFSVPGASNSNQPAVLYGNAWTQPGDITNVGKYVINSFSSYNSNLKNSTALYTDASFIRLKNASIYYKLPAHWQNWAHLSSARVYIQGQNLYTFTKYIGLDPEVQGLSLPPLRVIMAGVSTSF